MSSENRTSAPNMQAAAVRRHLICGAGGSRAILGSAGAIKALELAGISDWQTMGGISGGSIPTVLLASGMTPSQLLSMALDLDFSALVTRHATPVSTVIAFLLKDRFEFTRPKRGVLSSEKLGEFIDAKVPVWPAKYWTMAVVARTQILFTASGVYQYLSNGHHRVLSDQPAPLGLAVRASCAVPGIIDAVPYKGRYLFDGALSWDGLCPVGVLNRHFGAKADEIVGCDVGEDVSRWAHFLKWFWTMACGGSCVNPPSPRDWRADGVMMIEPQVDSVRSLQFTLTPDQKWRAVKAGFITAVHELAANGLLTGDKLEEARAIGADMSLLKKLAA